MPFSRPDTKGSKISPAISGGRPGPSSMISTCSGSGLPVPSLRRRRSDWLVERVQADRAAPAAPPPRRRSSAGSGTPAAAGRHRPRSAAARGRNPRRSSCARAKPTSADLRARSSTSWMLTGAAPAGAGCRTARPAPAASRCGASRRRSGRSVRGPRRARFIDRSCAAPVIPASGFLISCASISAMPMADFAADFDDASRGPAGRRSRAARSAAAACSAVVAERRDLDVACTGGAVAGADIDIVDEERVPGSRAPARRPLPAARRSSAGPRPAGRAATWSRC